VAALWRLSRWLREQQPHIIHTHLFVDGVFGRIAAMLAGVPHCIATQQNSYDPQHWLPRSQLWANRLLAQRTERFVAVSQGAKDYLQNVEGVPASKIQIIPNAIARPTPPSAEQLAACRAEFGLTPDQPVIGSVARLEAQKGLSTLIAACAQLVPHIPNLVCLIAGQGALRRQLESEIAQTGLGSHVRLLGPRLDVYPLMGLMDVFVLPSLFEGLPVALLEAMALGRACVATNVPGTREVITHSVDGCLVPANDVNTLAATIADLLSNASQRAQLGQAAADTVRRGYAIEPVAAAYEEIYEELMNKE